MTLIEAIMSRDECSIEEAQELFEEIVKECREDEDMRIEEILFEYGFEPDYILDVIPAI